MLFGCCCGLIGIGDIEYLIALMTTMDMKCIIFDPGAQNALPDHIKAKMKANQEKARTSKSKPYAYCKKSYTNNGLSFDVGYIEAIGSGERFSPNEHWRYATEKEIEDYFDINYLNRPKGRYFTNSEQ